MKLRTKLLPFPIYIFFPLIFLLTTFKVFNLDIWWHMKTGEYIVNNLSIPSHDIFSHTASGTPWVPTQWLFQVASYFIHNYLGINGLILTKAFLAVVVFGFLFSILRSWRVSVLLSVATLILFAAVARFRFFLRPDMASFLFLAIELYIIEVWQRDRRMSCFYLLPLTMLLWANSHSGVSIGMVVLFLLPISIVIKTLFKREGGWSDKELKVTLLLVLLSSSVTLINPSGLDLYLFAFEHYDIYERIGIGESVPPSFEEFPLYFMLLIFSWIVQLLTAQKVRIFNLLLLIFFTHLSLKTARMIGWWAVAAAPLTALNLHLLKEAIMERYPALRSILSANLKNVLVMLFMLLVFYSELFLLKGYHTSMEFGLGVKEGTYPEGAVRFIVENDLKGNMYNDQDFGGYILWRTYPARKVFSDPRMQVYYSIFPEFDDWPGLLKKYDISYGILEYPDSFDFKETPFPEDGWALVYWDDVAMVYLKRDSVNSDLIEKYGYDFITRPYDEEFSYLNGRLNDPSFLFQLKKELTTHHEAYRQKILMASLAYRQGSVNEAVALLEKAIIERPEMQNAYYQLGKLFVKRGKKKEAVRYLEKCLSLASYSKYGKLANLLLERAKDE